MFQAESEGLKALADTHKIRVPKPILVGSLDDGEAFFIMECILLIEIYKLLSNQDIPLKSTSSHTEKQLGEQLAMLHLHTNDTINSFGFHCDNTIGSTPQINTCTTIECIYISSIPRV
jgi:fructosamine-3-kinase